MKKITFSPFSSPRGQGQPPSWSWFSKEGVVKYMELRFEKIDWALEDLKSPFGGGKPPVALDERGRSASKGTKRLMDLRALARRLKMNSLEVRVHVIFDAEKVFEPDELRCVVIGRDKAEIGMNLPKQHSLIIRQVGSGGDDKIYERVGVASLGHGHVGVVDSWVIIR